jgi:hypothetical protein
MLDRLRNCDGSSQICIFTDNLESRLLAIVRAQDLRLRLIQQHAENKIEWDPNYQVPISFYLPKEKIIKYYSPESYQADIDLARKSGNNREKSLAYFIYTQRCPLNYAYSAFNSEIADEFLKIVSGLTSESQKIFFQLVKFNDSLNLACINFLQDQYSWKTPDFKLIKILIEHDVAVNFKTYLNISRYLTSSEEIELIIILKNQLPTLIKTCKDFEKIIRKLPIIEFKVVCETMKEQLPHLIKTIADAKDLLSNVIDTDIFSRDNSNEKSLILFDITKNSLISLIKTKQDLGAIHSLLGKKLRKSLYDALKEKLPTLFKTAQDFNSVFRLIPHEHRIAICHQLEEKWPKIIRSIESFVHVMKILDASERVYVCDALAKNLPDLINLINSADDYATVLSGLTPKQSAALCEKLQSKLPSLFLNKLDLVIILRHSTFENFQILFTPPYHQNVAGELAIKKFVDAFKETYKALRNDHGIHLFRSDFIKTLNDNDEMAAKQIFEHCREKPHSRTTVALYNLLTTKQSELAPLSESRYGL